MQKNPVDDFVEIQMNDSENDFLKIKETLERIGVGIPSKKELYQSCHILHKKGKYYITHFKEMFKLDGKRFNITDSDIKRRNSIIQLLIDWELCKVDETNQVKIESQLNNIKEIKIVKFNDKSEWKLIPKYNIGKIKLDGE